MGETKGAYSNTSETSLHAARFDVDADVGLRVGLNLSGKRLANMWKVRSPRLGDCFPRI